MSELVAPIYIGCNNAEAALGRSWRCVQDKARELGVQPRRVGRVTLYLASELVAAIERHASSAAATDEQGADEVEDLDRLRAKLGKRRRTG